MRLTDKRTQKNDSMKKVILSVLTLGMLTSCSCSGLNVSFTHTDAQAQEQRPLTGFERIELFGSLDVKYQQADSFSVRVEAPVEVLKKVETRVDGNKLVVKMKGDGNFINFGVADSRNVTVYVTSPDFLGIMLKGSGDFECLRLLDTDNLEISLQGSGDISFDDILCDQVDVSLVGSGDVELKNVKAQRSYISLVGSGDVKMNFDNSGMVEANLTGSGDITLNGKVQRYNSSVRGSGDMNIGGLMILEK